MWIKKLRKSFTRWNQLLYRSVLTPNSCAKFKIHSANADSPGVPNPISCLNSFHVGPVFVHQEIQEELYAVEPTPLQVSSYTKLLCKVQDPDSPGVPNPIFSLNNFDIGPVCVDQETQEDLYLVEPTYLQVSSYTKLLYKIHSVHADRPRVCYLIFILNNFHLGPVFASQIKKLRKSFTWWNQLLCRSVLTPNSCAKFKIHKVHADSPVAPNPISPLQFRSYSLTVHADCLVFQNSFVVCLH